MNKSSIQKKFRFIMVIAAIALFITIFLPAYIRYGNNGSYPKVAMMWTILFGAGGGAKLNNAFDFSWIAFVGYALAFILLIICLVSKFVTVEGDAKQTKMANTVVDASCLVCSLLALVMFVLLPLTITKTSVSPLGKYLIESYYGIGLAPIFAIIIALVMTVSSFIVLIAESIVKYKRIKDKKQVTDKNNSKEE